MASTAMDRDDGGSVGHAWMAACSLAAWATAGSDVGEGSDQNGKHGSLVRLAEDLPGSEVAAVMGDEPDLDPDDNYHAAAAAICAQYQRRISGLRHVLRRPEERRAAARALRAERAAILKGLRQEIAARRRTTRRLYRRAAILAASPTFR